MSDVHHTHPEVNKYQTPFDELGIDDAPQSVQESFWDFFDTVPYIQLLTSPDIPRAKDLPKDNTGKILIDVTKPHILEDMDYFRQTVLYYQQNGTYCPYKPNPNPNSSYMKWFAEETRRCWYGMVRPSDGEWITGDFYFFLNYFPMNITKSSGKGGRARRVIGFPSVWIGHYLLSHYVYQAREQGHHCAELASRGKGKSAFAAAMLAKRFLMGEDEQVSSKVISYITAEDKKYLVQSGDQTLDKFKFAIDFLAQRSELQWPRQKLINTIDKMQWQMGYKDLNTGANRGTLNSVIGVSSKDDEAKLRGSRGVLYIFEESGTFPRLLELYNNLRPSVEEGDEVYGQLFCYGTSGDSESDFRAFAEMIYSPQAYKLHAVENVYDKRGQGRKETTYFFPAYINRAGAYDENGNCDVTKALYQIMMARWQIRSRPGVDPKTVTNNVAQLPVTPQEAMMRTSGSIFPVHDLTQRLNQLLQDPSAMDGVAVGTLVMSSGGAVEFTPTDDDPIVEFPLRDNKARGALQIFSFPQKDSNGRAPRERYGIGLDPADSDDADTLSLTSIFVIDFFTDTIAAEYTGRMPFADDAYELARKLCLFYNCKILYENNIKGTYSYFLRMGCTHLLAETPEYLAGKDIATVKRIGNTKYGVTATLPVNNYANSLLRDWLLKPFGTVVKDKEGNEQEVVLPNLYRLKNIALIRELVAFNPNINVDRVRAMGIAMLYREEKVILYGGTPRPPEGQERDSGYLGADDFFSRNYDRRFRKHKEG